MDKNEIMLAAELLKRLDRDTEDLVDLLLDRKPDELAAVAKASGISFKGIELRIKTIRSAYRMVGKVRVKLG